MKKLLAFLKTNWVTLITMLVLFIGSAIANTFKLWGLESLLAVTFMLNLGYNVYNWNKTPTTPLT